jgi:hypothetical protein
MTQKSNPTPKSNQPEKQAEKKSTVNFEEINRLNFEEISDSSRG